MKRILTTLVLLTGLFGAGGAAWAGDSDPRAEYLKLLKAAKEGDVRSQKMIAHDLKYGFGGATKDLSAAHMWYNIASANGDWQDSGEERRRLEEVMSREQIAKAEERAKRCMDSEYKDCEAEPKSCWQKLD